MPTSVGSLPAAEPALLARIDLGSGVAGVLGDEPETIIVEATALGLGKFSVPVSTDPADGVLTWPRCRQTGQCTTIRIPVTALLSIKIWQHQWDWVACGECRT
jgi:hypothetical protein